MYMSSAFLLLISAVSAAPSLHNDDAGKHKRTITPDNTCGGSNGYACNPQDSHGGACCSAAGYCGNTDDYCGTGCQSAFGTCGSSTSPTQQPSCPPPTSGSAGISSPAAKEGCLWTVDGVGSFTHTLTLDFSALNALPSDVLNISTDTINSTDTDTGPRQFTTSNVAVKDGALQLTVPGGQTISSPITGAEVYTLEESILYGSVRTMMEVSSVSGTVSSPFFYQNDSQEADIEVLTGGQFQGVHYTNQKTSPGSALTTVTCASPADSTSQFYEYRLDWMSDRTDFYLGGVKQTSLTQNVPSQPGKWLWNNWR